MMNLMTGPLALDRQQGTSASFSDTRNATITAKHNLCISRTMSYVIHKAHDKKTLEGLDLG
jgi:hypothetical protein